MQTYSYVDKLGAVQNVDANSAGEAINAAPNIDPTSGVVAPPIRNEVSTLSTNQGQKIVADATASHQVDMAALTAQQTNSQTTIEKPKPAAGALTYDEAKSLGVDLNTATYDQGTNTYIPNADPNAAQTQQVNAKLQQDEGEINNAFSTLSQSADAATQGVISSINAIYAARIEDQRVQNQRSEKALTSFGIRAGTNRYAGEVQQGILSSEERAGLQKIATLSAQQAQLISSAQQALQDKKYTMFVEKRNELTKVRQAAQTQLQKLQDAALKIQDTNRQQQRQASRDSAISSLIEKGITNPAKMLQHLNYDQNGQLVGNFTSKEVSDSVKSLAPEGDLKSLNGETRNFYLLQQKNMLPESITSLPKGEQLFAYLRQEKQATTIYKASASKPGKAPIQSVIKPPAALINQGLQDLHDPRVFGSDQYVDPLFYKAKYSAWVEDGYSPQDFIKYFPPKTYINPEDNQFLPSYLQTSAKSKATNKSASRA